MIAAPNVSFDRMQRLQARVAGIVAANPAIVTRQLLHRDGPVDRHGKYAAI